MEVQRFIARRARTVQDCASFIESARSKLAALGIIRIEVRDDFDEYVQLICDPEKHIVWEQFDPSRHPLLHRRAVWFCCYDKQGEIVLVMGMRLDDLGEATLAEQMETLLPLLGGGRPEEMAPKVCQISGKAVYQGGMWVRDDLRSKQVAPWFCRYTKAVALLMWWPDWVYGFIDQWMHTSGFPARMGFATAQTHVIAWQEEPRYEPDYLFVADSQAELCHMILTGHEPYVRQR
ncbi:MAG: hypothetical protein AAF441_20375 [Pseudomonadota bacterium]